MESSEDRIQDALEGCKLGLELIGLKNLKPLNQKQSPPEAIHKSQSQDPTASILSRCSKRVHTIIQVLSIHVHVYIQVYMHIYISTYIYIYVCVCISMRLCMYISLYLHVPSRSHTTKLKELQRLGGLDGARGLQRRCAGVLRRLGPPGMPFMV